MYNTVLTVVLVCVGAVIAHENRPPGIPPSNQQQQHAHNLNPPGQNQGQNMQFQAGQHQQGANIGQFDAQGNVQNMQQQQQQQQQQHGFRQKQEVHNAEHIKEHLKEVVDKPKEEMTDEELEFHYFKLHDYDGNNKLDGTEITKAITHFHSEHEEDQKQGEQAPARKVFTDSELVNIVDLVLKEDDLDNDGYIEYAEFVTAQRKAQSDDKKPAS